MKRFVSRERETLRMFENRFMEFFSKVHWTVPIALYLPLIGFLLWISANKLNLKWFGIWGAFLSGIAFWTLVEYLLHRFVFHYHPKSQFGKRIFWILHGVHHDYPSDPLRLVMPPIVSAPLAVIFYFLFVSTLGTSLAPPVMSGFTLGYLAYDVSHYAIHHFTFKGSFFGRIREHHLRHHFKDSERGFGVSSAVWDRIFKTAFQSEQAQKGNQAIG
jgi:sterol desaturase/sphingolipid hydroxylase (fatty acid hydroxylase superfamily)